MLKALVNYPGLEFDMPLKGNKLGRVLNNNKNDFIPTIKRINWLTFVSEEGVKIAGGIQ